MSRSVRFVFFFGLVKGGTIDYAGDRGGLPVHQLSGWMYRKQIAVTAEWTRRETYVLRAGSRPQVQTVDVPGGRP